MKNPYQRQSGPLPAELPSRLPSRLPSESPSNPPATTQHIVKYTTIVRPQRRYHVWQRAAGGLTLLLTLSLLSVYFFYQHAQPLARQPGLVATTAYGSSRLAVGTLRQGLTPIPSPSPDAPLDLFAAPATTPEQSDPSAIFSRPVDAISADQLPATPVITQTVANQADPLVAAAKAEPQLYRTFLSAQDALEQADPQQAIATLLTLAQNHPAYLAEQVTAVLYRAYLDAGDQSMRDGERPAAADFYAQAQRLAVPDQSALTRRLQSMARFLQTTTTVAAVTTVLPPDVAGPTAMAAVVTPTPTPEPTATTAGAATVVTNVAVNSASCPNPQVTISAPAAGTTLTGSVSFNGSASLDNFWFYKLEWARAGSEDFAYFAGSRLPVTGGWLGTLDSTMLLNGDYVIRLTAVDLTGNYPPACELAVRVEN